MEFRGIMGGFYRISEWIMRLSVINVLWVICALPFFILALFGLMSLQVDDTLNQFYSMLWLCGIVSPFTLFPSTAAMFSVARKWLTGEEDVSLFKTFFRGYKDNFKQAMLGGLIYLVFGIIIAANFYYYNGKTGGLGVLRYLVLTLTVLLSVSLFHFFSILSHLHMKLLQIIKNAVLISIGHPVRSVSMIVLNGVVIYFSLTKFTFLIPFFMGSIIAVISFWHFNTIFGRLQAKQQELAEKEAEASEEQQTEAEETAQDDVRSLQEGRAPGEDISERDRMNQRDEEGNTNPSKQ
ncbi:hypothetical protein SK3146_01970 [Paenibacillus konkukensis]|uniref:DUF624 domain-containing protein n=1 Tax=Paenibacillus konkukensis TaxID=2020716 RepID=A0ABY4RLP0_9BACL|nr:DUF624 domain-containing protein [Paenibacillus konkukensis]UQZ82810.1 hypothetical protein SK3146_01970 [Paenibacillus konkukensis]